MQLSRLISPPLAELDRLRPPLEPGECEVLAWLDRHLKLPWEIYIQPHLNGLRPDFVLLHPRAGIIVLEVKDWDFSAMEYRVQPREDAAPALEIRTQAGWKMHEASNPISKLHLYRDEIQNLYCPSLGGADVHRLVSCAAIFTRATRDQAVELLRPSIDHYFSNLSEYPLNCAVVGTAELATNDLGSVLRVALNTSQRGMTDAVADDLRHWLNEPEYSAEQRREPRLTDKQRNLVQTKTEKGYRRIKGPAGSGKSLVLAGRAAQLVAQGKRVLVVTYNLTLINYLQDLVVQWPMPQGVRPRCDIVWLNFHAWCRRIFFLVGESESYRQLWRRHFEAAKKREEEIAAAGAIGNPAGDDQLEAIFNDAMAQALSEAIAKHPEPLERFDAVLVDEAQDFRPSWISLLRHVVEEAAKDGEYLIVADKSQNIYGTAHLLSEGAMAGCGFRAPWSSLSECHRMPTALIPLVSDYARRFLPEDSRDIPVTPDSRQGEMALDFFGRWVQRASLPIGDCVLDEILRLAAAKDIEHLPISDITVIVLTQRRGIELVRALEAKNIRCLHTFAPDDRRESRRLKTRFYKGAAQVKVTTIHSFKGLECRALVIAVDAPSPQGLRQDQLALLYTAMTRLKATPRGSYLTIICNQKEMADYGSNWPDFVS